MGERVTRRTMLAAAASLLSACSRMTHSVSFVADEQAMPLVVDAVRRFADAHNYRVTDSTEPLTFNYDGQRSRFWFYRTEIGEFRAELFHHDEILFGPPDDLETWLEEFKGALRKIDGVRFAEGYA